MLVHYAAACETNDPLKFLINEGQDVTIKDEKGITPLMIACKTSKSNNVREILNKDSSNLNLKTKEG